MLGKKIGKVIVSQSTMEANVNILTSTVKLYQHKHSRVDQKQCQSQVGSYQHLLSFYSVKYFHAIYNGPHERKARSRFWSQTLWVQTLPVTSTSRKGPNFVSSLSKLRQQQCLCTRQQRLNVLQVLSHTVLRARVKCWRLGLLLLLQGTTLSFQRSVSTHKRIIIISI